MPIRAYLDGQKLDGETIRQVGIAFEMALAALGSLRAPTTPFVGHWLRAIGLAQVGERDPDRLCEGALQAVSPAVHRDSPPVQPEG